jgi:hypothetical protein
VTDERGQLAAEIAETERIRDAVSALRARGIDNAEELLAFGTPEEILAACRRWDARPAVGPGLLARWIRDQDFSEPEPTPAPSKTAGLRTLFADIARRYPVGTVLETHAELIERRWPQDADRAEEAGEPLCPGWMVVIAATWPLLESECDACRFLVGIPAAAPALESGE